MKYAFFAAIACLLAVTPQSWAQSVKLLSAEQGGVTILVAVRSAAETSAVGGVPTDEAVATLKSRVRSLTEGSPFIKDTIRRLRKQGTPIVFYDPADGRGATASSLSVVHADDPLGLIRQIDGALPVWFTHRGMRAPAAFQASLIAYQLGGGGRQRIDGRFKSSPTIDDECERRLYMAQAVQDLVSEKERRTDFWVWQRKALVARYCGGFIQWLAANPPADGTGFNRFDLNVPRLLDLFGRYRKEG